MAAPTTGRTQRLGWGLADQALSSASNSALAIIVAIQFDAEAFGAFAVAVMSYTFALVVTRALAAEPLAVRLAGADADDLRRSQGQVLGLAVWIGCGAALVVAVPGLLVDELRPALLPLAVAFPGLIVQDVCRFALTTDGRSRSAVANDACWVIVEFGLLGVLWATDRLELAALVAVWGLSATIAAGVGLRQLRNRPRPRSARRWLSTHRDLWPRFVVEGVSSQGSWQIAVYAIGVVVSLEAVGAIRAAQTLLGPITVIFLAVPLVVLQELSRGRRGGETALIRDAVIIATGLAATALVWGGAMQLIPDDIGERILGDSWPGASQVLAPLTVYMALTGVSLGALAGLRTLQAARASVRVGVAAAPPLVVAAIAGGATGGVVAAVWAMVGAGALAAAMWWTALVRSARSAGTAPAGPVPARETAR